MLFKSWYAKHDLRTRVRYVLWVVAAASALAFITYYSDFALRYYFNPMRTNPTDRILILTTSWCPFCKALKKVLTEAKLPYAEIDVEKDWKSRYAYHATHSTGVPVTIIGSRKFRGGMARQLAAIKDVCERTNGKGKYDCKKLDEALRVWHDRSSWTRSLPNLL